MDFTDKLLESKGFHAILVITDWYTKVHYYILANTIWIAADVANIYINKI